MVKPAHQVSHSFACRSETFKTYKTTPESTDGYQQTYGEARNAKLSVRVKSDTLHFATK